jgi:glycosyltransferase involved in cell wall biosynthesis
MKVAAITITYNRLELTKKTVESFYSKTKVDYHCFIDNGSTDGTKEFILKYPHILLEKNYGITDAFCTIALQLQGYDFILKLDNDIEVVTDEIIEKMMDFYKLNGMKYVCSPVDLNLDPHYQPNILKRVNLKGFNAQLTTHTGGAFQMIPFQLCQDLCNEYKHFKQGDFMIGRYYRERGYSPAYLTDLQMRHIGFNQTSPNYIL